MAEIDPDGRLRLKILVIDDDELVRGTLCAILEDAGYEVAEAVDGKQGVALFATSPADLVITDMFMPEKDGVETVIELRHQFPSVKIIAISGGGRARNLDFLEFSRNVGAARILLKPFTPDDVVSAVKEALGASHP